MIFVFQAVLITSIRLFEGLFLDCNESNATIELSFQLITIQKILHIIQGFSCKRKLSDREVTFNQLKSSTHTNGI